MTARVPDDVSGHVAQLSMPSIFASLSACTSAESVYALLERAHVDAKVASHALHCLGRLLQPHVQAGPKSSACLSKLTGALEASTPALSSRELSKAAWGVGKVWSYYSRDTEARQALLALDAIASSAASEAEALDAQAVATILHAHGTLSRTPGASVMRTLQRRVAALASASQCGSQDVANVLWALGRLGSVVEPSLASALDSELPRLLPRFKPMEVSSTAWALAKAQLFPPAELSRIILALHRCLGTGQGRTENALLRALSAQGAANCLWAFSRTDPPPPAALVSALVHQAARQGAGLTPQGLANVCAACARLSGPAGPCVQLLDQKGAMEALGASDVAEVGWAVARMYMTLREDGNGGSEEVIACLRRVAPALWSRTSRVASQFGWQESAHLDFALRTLQTAEVRDARDDAGRAALIPRLSEAAIAAIDAVKRERACLEAATTRALLEPRPSPWASLPRGAPVLLAGFGSAGGAVLEIADALSANLTVSYWHRFADSRLPKDCPPAAAWPNPSKDALYTAAVLRLPPSRAALEYALHAVASVLRPGGLLVIAGCRVEGMHATRAHVPTQLFEDVVELPSPPTLPTGTPASATVLTARRTQNASDCLGVDAFAQRTSLTLPTPASLSAAATKTAAATLPPLPWLTLPGLFAGGGLDVMTTVLLQALPLPSPRARVLDFCAGSGVIAAALRAREPTLRLTLLDADALAVHAANENLHTKVVNGSDASPNSSTRVLLSDSWEYLPRRPRFDLIVSNPPVHLGLQTDFRILRTLVAGAAKRLKAGGQLWIVAQTYVPVGQLLARQAQKLTRAAAIFDDGRFTVWSATRAPRRSKNQVEEGSRKRGPDETGLATKAGRKRAR